MLKFYHSGAPNPTKVALFLEETGTPCDPIPIDTRKGEQHAKAWRCRAFNSSSASITSASVSTFGS